jgi:hypothetical protein
MSLNSGLVARLASLFHTTTGWNSHSATVTMLLSLLTVAQFLQGSPKNQRAHVSFYNTRPSLLLSQLRGQVLTAYKASFTDLWPQRLDLNVISFFTRVFSAVSISILYCTFIFWIAVKLRIPIYIFDCFHLWIWAKNISCISDGKGYDIWTRVAGFMMGFWRDFVNLIINLRFRKRRKFLGTAV